MKYRLTYTLLLTLLINQLFAQITETEIKSDGIIVPRVDRTLTIGEEGQLIYDINSDSYWYHDGAIWIPVGNQSVQSNQITDDDEDTSVEVERSGDIDEIIFQVAGTDALTMKKNGNGYVQFNAESSGSNNNLFFGDFTGEGVSGHDNTLIGHGIMILASPGYGNVALGKSALSGNTGIGNTAIGFQSLANNQGSANNTGVGGATMQANISGENNTAMGFQAANLLTSGNENVALGYRALLMADQISESVAVGAYALENDGLHKGNTAVGFKALQMNGMGNMSVAEAIQNTAVGYQSGMGNLNGINNTFLGYQTGVMNSGGMDNVFIGSEAGNQNTDGLSNVIIGSQAGQENKEGESNVYIGFQAGQNAEALVNTMIGNKAGQMTTSGFSNVFLGSTAGNFNKSGEQNAYLGAGAGFFNGGSFNTFVGNGAGAGSMPLSSNGNVFIGYFAGSQETGDSLLYIDNSSSATPLIWGNFKQGAKEVRVNGDFCYTGSLLTCSDLRFKNNIKPIENALIGLTSLQGITHEWRHEEFEDFVWSKRSEYGVLAQEVEAIFPELVSEDDRGYKFVNYTKFTPLFIEAIKEQQDQIDRLKQENSELKTLLQKHESLLNEISQHLKTKN